MLARWWNTGKRVLAIALLSLPSVAVHGDEAVPDGLRKANVQLKVAEHALDILVDNKRALRYVWRDAMIPRPYFAHLAAPGGVPLSRSHPPVIGRDATDHADYHPGLWLAFGDISGHDYWRLKARVAHRGFTVPPDSGPGWARWESQNRYYSSDSTQVVCEEKFQFSFLVHKSGYLLLWESTFSSAGKPLVFGDQEEMGLGVRMSTPLTVTHGGRIVDSQSRVNGKEVWGTQSKWCDYHGRVDDQLVGVCLMPHPENFRSSWFHARDYGLLAANPFGRQALGRMEKSAVTVAAGEQWQLRFGILLHARPLTEKGQLDPAKSVVPVRQRDYEDYLRIIHMDREVR